MTLYSVIPIEQILEGIEDKLEPCLELHISGVIMQVQPVGAHQARIVRMISPDPQHYLNPAFAPGQFIDFYPSI